MTWTTTRPEKPGWYWWREYANQSCRLVWVNFQPQDAPMVIYPVGNNEWSWLYDMKGQWAGPIPPPEE